MALNRLNERLSTFYINFNLSQAVSAEQREKDFLSHHLNHQSELVRQRRIQYGELLENYNLTPDHLKWYSKVEGDRCSGVCKL